MAMTEEIRAIERNNTWELTDMPKGARPIGIKWVYKKKTNAEGEVERYKARLVVKGYKQKEGRSIRSNDEDGNNQVVDFLSSSTQMDNLADGCEVNISEWSLGGGSIC